MLCVAFQFLGVLEKELAKFEKNKDDFLSDFTQVIQQKHLRNSSHGLAGRLGACILSFVSLTSLTLKFTYIFQEDYDDIVNGWKAKLQRSSAGEQRWGLFIATK
jgi:phosphoethanolamine N-methyltransferase